MAKNLQLYSMSSATISGTNITSSITDYTGSTLNLSGNTTIGGGLYVGLGNSSFNMNGHTLNAGYLVNFGYDIASSVTITNRGAITTPTSRWRPGTYGNRSFNLIQGDSVTNFTLQGVTHAQQQRVEPDFDSRVHRDHHGERERHQHRPDRNRQQADPRPNLNLGNAPNTGLNIQDVNSVLDAQGHSITANLVYIGQAGTSAVTVSNLGLVTVNSLEVGNGSL